jgi:hypothetical protein
LIPGGRICTPGRVSYRQSVGTVIRRQFRVGLVVSGILLLGAGLLIWSNPRGHDRRDESANTAEGSRFSPLRSSPSAGVERRDTRDPANKVRAPDSRLLFRVVDRPADSNAIESRTETATVDIHYVEVNTALFAGKASPLWGEFARRRLTLPLPDHGSMDLVELQSEVLGPQRYVIRGILEGHPKSRILLAYNRGAVAGQFSDPELGEYHLRTVSSLSGEVGQFFRIETDHLKPCAGGMRPSTSADSILAWSTRNRMSTFQAAPGPTDALKSAADLTQPIVARLLFLYTRSVRLAYGTSSQVEAVIDLAVAAVNSDFVNSQIPVRIQLAASQEVTLNESNLNYERTLDSLRGRNDGVLDAIHAARDETAADLVTLGVSANDTGNSLGIAYLLETPGDYVNAYFAFSVVQFGVITSNSVLSHELGHNFGCAHDRENAANPGAFPYSFGYRFFARDTQGANRQLRDIMAYAPGNRLPYFSNPRIRLTQAEIGSSTVTFNSPVALGVEAGQPGEADNARTIAQTAFEVASYRISPDLPYHTGTLINVATRAFVGSGVQQLIGGFIVKGTTGKSVLIRAVGPSLSAFGVAEALPDPVLRVFRSPDPLPLAENDNWGDQARPQDTMVQGFPLPNGSRDAALLLTLAPGSYTANIEGRNGATGIALVEAYEVERASEHRLINLSTRAFADGTRPMVAGFVIAADPSSTARTKRVLVRVLGPTLLRFGVTGVLEDPIMTLYDATGQALLENDDWDPPTANLGLGVVTVRGEIDQPSEQTIFEVTSALNLPAMTPLEPAIVVDLQPGSYTVIVRPFENEEQPAVPGVGIVEVYEVSPP